MNLKKEWELFKYIYFLKSIEVTESFISYGKISNIHSRSTVEGEEKKCSFWYILSYGINIKKFLILFNIDNIINKYSLQLLIGEEFSELWSFMFIWRIEIDTGWVTPEEFIYIFIECIIEFFKISDLRYFLFQCIDLHSNIYKRKISKKIFL